MPRLKGRERPLTKRQTAILKWIIAYIAKHRYPPAVRDLCEQFGTTPCPMQQHLTALARKGYVRRTRGVSRGLRVVREPD